MKESNYEQEKSRRNLEREIFRLVKQDNVSIQEVVQQYGVSRSSIYRIIATFERENPLEAELIEASRRIVVTEESIGRRAFARRFLPRDGRLWRGSVWHKAKKAGTK